MVGHGSPLPKANDLRPHRPLDLQRWRTGRDARWSNGQTGRLRNPISRLSSSYIWFAALALIASLSLPRQSIDARGTIQLNQDEQVIPFAQPNFNDSFLTIRLRLAWGGPSRSRWTGRFAVSEGTIESFSSLSLEPISPGSKAIEQGQLWIYGRAPTVYDGVELILAVPRSASLNIELQSDLGSTDIYDVSLPIEQLLRQRHSEEIDNRGNLIVIDRAFHDRIRFEFDREALVFDAGETTRFDVHPFEIGLSADTRYDVELNLIHHASGQESWSHRVELHTDDRGELRPIDNLELVIPEIEGAYDLYCDIRPISLTSSLLRPRPVLTGMVQFVVIGQSIRAVDEVEWETTTAFDPANPGWWDRMLNSPQVRALTFWEERGPLTNLQTSVVDIGQRRWTELPPGGWVAYPIPVRNPGLLHLLEVEYPNAAAQQLCFSLVEPNEAGRVLPLGPDGGIRIRSDQESTLESEGARWHQLHLWPKTTLPLLVISNLDQQTSARFGRIQLSMRSNPAFESIDQSQPLVNENGRKYAVLLDAPLMAESFSAPEWFDPIAERTLDSWHTFHVSTNRLIESMSLKGQNTAVISALNEGSTIYPSRLLEPTPKYDSGIFATTGQDPVRKDVLEMMFRMFDREGLTLIPQLEFSSPLPQIEALLRRAQRDGVSAESIYLLQDVTVLQEGIADTISIRYNPASLEVQQAMLDVISELVQRYAHHPSFGGISIRMAPNTYTHFPNERWGYDPVTVRRFLMAQGTINLQSDPADVSRAFYDVVRSQPEAYLEWRRDQLTGFYERVAAITTRSKSDARAYLTMANMFRDQPAVRALAPGVRGEMPKLDWVLLGMGIDPPRLNQSQGLVAWLPLRQSATDEISEQRVELHLESSGALTQSFGDPREGGVFVHQNTTPFSIDAFQQLSPYGADRTERMLFPHMYESDHSIVSQFLSQLARNDQREMVTGGLLVSPNHDGHLQQVMQEFQAIPDQPFEDVEVSMPGGMASPVVIRTLRTEERVYAYMVNPTPWPVNVDMTLVADRPIFVRSPTGRRFRVVSSYDTTALLQATLGGFDLAVAEIELPLVEISGVRAGFVDANAVSNELRRNLLTYQTEVASAKSTPIPWPVIRNPGFESLLPNTDGGAEIEDWEYASSSSTTIAARSTESIGGERALYLASDGSQPAWIRSSAFDAPVTGRVSISVWLKLANGQQPPLRLSIQAKHRGNEYYRYAVVGAFAPNDAQRQLGTEWKRFGVHFDDLPPDGITDLKIGFDLMEEGEVWIDDVEVFDFWLDEHDVINLLVPSVVMEDAFIERDYVKCVRYLHSYWPRFLMQRPSLRRQDIIEPSIETAEETNQSFPRNVLDSVRGFAPQNVLPFR